MKPTLLLIATAIATGIQAVAVPAPERAPLIQTEVGNLTDSIWYKERYGDADPASVAGEGGVLAKRDYCGTGSTFDVGEMRTLISNLQSDGGNDYVPHSSWKSWTRGTARICTYNRYITENTHVSHWEFGWGANYIMDRCCNPNGNPQW
jgi:hypothetical protein